MCQRFGVCHLAFILLTCLCPLRSNFFGKFCVTLLSNQSVYIHTIQYSLLAAWQPLSRTSPNSSQIRIRIIILLSVCPNITSASAYWSLCPIHMTIINKFIVIIDFFHPNSLLKVVYRRQDSSLQTSRLCIKSSHTYGITQGKARRF